MKNIVHYVEYICTCSVSFSWKSMCSLASTEETTHSTTHKGNVQPHKITTKNKYKPQRLKNSCGLESLTCTSSLQFSVCLI